MYDHTEYKVGLGIDFEIFMKETLGAFCTPIGGIKCREERQEEYRCHTVTPDLLFETNGFRFYVDCHYRSSMPHAYVELDYPGVYRLKERCFERRGIRSSWPTGSEGTLTILIGWYSSRRRICIPGG